MDEPWSALGRKLDEIEAEMKRIGYWSDAPRVGGATSSFTEAPSFELWLQTVFLRNARDAVRARQLPADSQVGLMAIRQYDYHSQVPEAQRLTDLLSEFDALVRGRPRPPG